jgi:hypothetical protein
MVLLRPLYHHTYLIGTLVFRECLPGICGDDRRQESIDILARYCRDEKSVDESEDYFDSKFSGVGRFLNSAMPFSC